MTYQFDPNMSKIIAFNFDQRDVRIGLVDDDYSIRQHISKPALEIQNHTLFILDSLQEYGTTGITGIGIALTYLLRKPHLREGYKPATGEKLIDAKKIEEETGLPTYLYNDGEASALATRNLPNLQQRLLQRGELKSRERAFHIFLDTGFMGCVSDVLAYREDKTIYGADYGFYWNSNISVGAFDVPREGKEFVDGLAERINVPMHKLRYTHLLGRTGLEHIDSINRGKLVRNADQIIKDVRVKLNVDDKETLALYSGFLGAALKQFFEAQPRASQLFVEGPLAAEIGKLLNREKILQHFNPGGIYRTEYSRVPITVITDPHTTLRGAAFAMRNDIRTTAGVAQSPKE